MKQPSLSTSFKRSQVAAITATAVDFGSLVALVEWAHIWYVAATAIGATLGALTNFMMGRHWSFEAAGQGIHGQALRYALVSGGSLLLNSAGVWGFTEFLGWPYPISKLAIAVIVGVAYNFPMHRRFVFRSTSDRTG